MDTINIGLVGYKFMGTAHSNAYRQVSHFFDPKLKPVMKAICGRTEEAVAAAADKLGWEEYETDWRELVARDDIDLVDICTPGGVTHKEIALGAAEAGKDILCEKPLANSLADAQEMLEAVEKAGVRHMVNFNYRRAPAVALAKRMIEEGMLGKIYHWRAVYLQDWIIDPEFPLVWRLDKSIAGSGPLGDLAAHSIDLAHYLVGDIAQVTGMMQTFIEERPLPAEMGGLTAVAREERGEVTVEDAVAFLARFACTSAAGTGENGVFGTFEATRFAAGHKNYNRFEVNGSKGSLVFNFERMNELQYYSREDDPDYQGFRVIQATEGTHPYMSAWWPPGHIIGFEHTFIHGVYDLLNDIAEGEMPIPSFVDGVKCQAVMEAVGQSAQSGEWVEVEQPSEGCDPG
ncbi:MAG: Gfo/Idh/MocA family oxidoreductase [Chloroflexota bacterium]|nr:Gfo/Idh/MocA family oxidoreductase [Chloroflexota bacterium]